MQSVVVRPRLKSSQSGVPTDRKNQHCLVIPPTPHHSNLERLTFQSRCFLNLPDGLGSLGGLSEGSADLQTVNYERRKNVVVVDGPLQSNK